MLFFIFLTHLASVYSLTEWLGGTPGNLAKLPLCGPRQVCGVVFPAAADEAYSTYNQLSPLCTCPGEPCDLEGVKRNHFIEIQNGPRLVMCEGLAARRKYCSPHVNTAAAFIQSVDPRDRALANFTLLHNVLPCTCRHPYYLKVTEEIEPHVSVNLLGCGMKRQCERGEECSIVKYFEGARPPLSREDVLRYEDRCSCSEDEFCDVVDTSEEMGNIDHMFCQQ